MIAFVRAGLVAALAVFFVLPAFAQEKSFQRSELADAAIKLEEQIKTDAGTPKQPAAQLRRDAEAAFQKNDFRGGMVILGQAIAAAPDDASGWLRLARTVSRIRPRDDKEQAFFLERASVAAYIAYQRTKTKAEEGESLAVLGQLLAERKQYRGALDALRLALDQRETAELRGQYERLRAEYGFRMLNYTVDSDAISPRACFQFSEELPGKKTDLSPFVSVVGVERPAISTTEKQLCVEGLKHGERYQVTLRAGLPSVVRETLPKSAEFGIYVRDRKPFARFAGKAYVLPKTGQRGIPVLSVNADTVAIDIYRIGDRNLIDTILGSEFQRTLYRYQAEQLGKERGTKIWGGELAVESKLNTEVTTAFPVTQAAGDLGAGIYVMTAAPKGPSEEYEQLATQWFIVSDLGLTAYTGAEGVDVFVHSLATAEPRGLTEVRLIARNNEVLASKRTDGSGFVHFDAGLARGEGGLSPAAVVAQERSDYAFLSLKTPAFDLTDRGVAGRQTPAGLDAFVYTERGVYRSGETVHATALLRDARGIAALNVPLTLIVERPDGVEYRRVLLNDMGLGGRSLSVPLVASAATGTWRLRAYTDPKRPPVGETTFMVEDYVPDRIEFELKSSATAMPRNVPVKASVEGRFLYGAPAAGLDLEGELTISAASERVGFPGYTFGLSDEDVTAIRQPLEDLAPTDKEGKAEFEIALDKLPATARPLQAQLTIRLAEAGGRAVERKLTLPVANAEPMIGIKPAFAGRSLGDGEEAGFDIVYLGADGKPQARSGLRYELLRVETRYQWYRTGSAWEYEPVKITRRVADGRLDVTADAPKRLALPVQWGRYRLEIADNDAVTSLSFDAGFYAESSADTPDLLELALDKNAYRAGEAMNVAVTARAAGKVTINVFTDRLVSTTTQEVKPGATPIKLTVGKDWGTGAYVVATLRRPLDAAAQRMPGRAIGVQWFSIDRAARTLNVEMSVPQTIRPNGALTIPVKIGGLAAREEARIVVSAVDVGILNLTNYKPPAPDDFYLGQRRLTSDIRDLYGQLIDGMQGVAGRIRTGGDAGAAELSGSPPTQPPLALYSGIVTVGADGTAQVNFDVPAFAGTLRVMAVAWSKDKVGKAAGDVVVRDPVVLTATLPRFMRSGDKGALQIEIDNVEGAPGDYVVGISGEGTVKPAEAQRKLTLGAKQRDRLAVPLSAEAAGPATIRISVEGPNGIALARAYAIETRPATQILSRRTVYPLAKGESISVPPDAFADFVAGTGTASVSVALTGALDAATLLTALDRYPYGCSEQIASRAVALLYANELATAASLASDGALDQRIRDSITSLLARQDSTGGFGLWAAGSEDTWLSAYVTEFLTRSRERKFEVPDNAFKSALDHLRNFVASAPEPAKDGGRKLAYALYVLARNGAAPVGDLRYYADVKLGDFATPIAKAQIAAALGMLGDKPRADRVYAAALESIAASPALELGRPDYGSALRDSAAVVTLASESGAPRATVDGAISRIEAARRLSTLTSTQEQAWLIMAARSLAKEASAIRLDVDGAAHQGVFHRVVRAATLNTALRVANAGEGQVQAVVTVSGAPLTPEPSADRGLKVERSYFTLQGETADPSEARQNQRFVVVLKVTDPNPQFSRLILADYLPAGFEIDNPRLVSSGDAGKMAWIENAVTPAHVEFRDDRFAAAFERRNGDQAVFAVAYVVRAVSPGQYTLPQAMIEDMYRPDRFGRTATGAVEVTSAK